jgi:hypothetical protein
MHFTSTLSATAAFLFTLFSANAALVAHYEFEETSGTTLTDSSGNGFDASVVNPNGTGDLNVAGAYGGSSGYRPGSNVNDYGVRSTGTSDFGITGNNARTISFWFNTPSFGDQFRLLGMGQSAAQKSFDITAENNANSGNANRIGLRYGNGNVFFDADNSGTAFAINTWYHVAYVYDGTTLGLGDLTDSNGLSVFVNGVQIDADGGNLNNPTQVLNTGTGNFAFGARNDLSQFNLYPGLLDDVQVYDEALSAAEVTSLYNDPGSAIPEPSGALFGLVGCGLLLVRRRRC